MNNDQLFSTLLKAKIDGDTETYNTNLKNAKEVIKDMTRIGLEAIDELNEEHQAKIKETESTKTANKKAVSGFDGHRFG